MTAHQLLASVQARGVVLWREGDALRLQLPPAINTDPGRRARLLDTLRAAKSKLLPLLPDVMERGAPASKTPSGAAPPVAAVHAFEGDPVLEACEAPIASAELREQERVGALLIDAWQALVAGRLAVGSFEIESGRWVTDPACWLHWARRHRAHLLHEHGPTWWDTDVGQILAQDLYAFADWFAVAGLAEEEEDP